MAFSEDQWRAWQQFSLPVSRQSSIELPYFAGGITLLYSLFGWLWMTWADRLLAIGVGAGLPPAQLLLIKEWGFLGITAIGLFSLLWQGLGQLQKRQKVLHNIIDTANEAIYVKDVQGQYLIVNQTAAQWLKLQPSQIVGRSVKDFMEPEETQRIHDEELEIWQTGEPRETEHAVTIAGEQRYFLTTKSLCCNERNQPIGIVCITREITSYKQAENRLREREEIFRQLAETVEEAFVIQTADFSQTLYISPGYERIWQRPCEALYQNPSIWQESVHPDDRDRVVAEIQQVMHGEICHTEFRILRPNGEVRWVIVHGFPLRDDAGTIYRVVGSAHDITDLRQAEGDRQQATQLRTELNVLESILESAIAGYWDWDITGNTTYLSPMFKQMFGYEDHELPNVPQTWQTLVLPEDLPILLNSFEQHARSRGQSSYHNEVRYRHKDGSIVWVICAGRIIEWNNDGQPIRMVGCHVDITHRKQAEEELNNLSDRLTLALQSGAIGTWEWHIAENRRFWDGRMYELYAVQPREDEDLCQVWAQCIHPEDWPRVEKALYQAACGELDFDLEFRIIHPDRTIHTIKASALVQRDDQGQPIRMIGINYEITDRKQVEQALKDSEARLQAMVENAPGIIVTYDRQGRITYINRTLSGKSPQDFLGIHYRDCVLPQYHAQQDQGLIQVFEHGATVEYEVEGYIDDSGNTAWYQVTTGPIRQGDQVVMAIATAIDITDRKQVEIALRESEHRYATLTESAPVAIFRLDAQGQCIYVNSQWGKMMGRSLESALGIGCFDTLHPEDRDRIFQDWARKFQQGEGLGEGYQTESRHVHPSGRIIWCYTNVVAETDAQGQLIGYVGTLIDISDRKEAEQSLRRYERMVNATDDGMLLIDRNYVYQVVNQSAEQDHGKSSQEMVGRRVNEVMGQVAFDQILKAQLDECFLGNTHQYSMWLELPGNPDPQFVNFSLSPYREADQTISGAVISARNLTHLKRIEEALRESERRYATLAAAAPVAIFQFDHPGNCVYVNDRWSEMTGRPKESALGQGWLNALHPDDREIFYVGSISRNAFDNELVDGNPHVQAVEGRHLRPDGTINWFYCQVAAEMDADGAVVGYVGTLTDITERKHTEQALQESRAMLQTILDTIPQRVFWKDRQLHYLGCNRAFAQDAGLPDANEILGKTDFEMPWINFASAYQADDTDVINQGIAKLNYEELLQNSTGEQHWLQTSKVPLTNSSGEIVGILGTYEDITELKQSEAQLRQMNEQLAHTNLELERATRLKDEFLANMSHELRTPLNAVLGMAQSLQDGILGSLNERQIKAIATIDRSGNHLLELINDILDLAKIESGKLELDISPVSIRSLCDMSLTFVRQMAAKKNIQLNSELSPNLGRVLADERRLRQVLINLLDNAIKFTANGGTVTLSVRYSSVHRESTVHHSDHLGHWVEFSVTDTGIGIAAENFNKLFQPFVQIDSSLNRQYSGTGLGLSLVRRIAELHGGNVTVQSELGRGSCFTVQIPDAFRRTFRNHLSLQMDSEFPPSQDSAIDQDFANDPELLESRNELSPSTTTDQLIPVSMPSDDLPLILLAEDNLANIDTFTAYLESRGYRLILANNGQDAIDLTQAHRPDIILMDIQMPGLDGLSAIRQIRTMPEITHIPIIALTALAMLGDREKCLSAGANAYMAKPVLLKQLVLTIEKLLAKTSH
ncbi:PAS domain S-box protein [Alkalinema pantanalense]|uniref:PAS domain S-box protein n=1 Tax=Alkalinema pantanalense TaxID=1620705 RepID=UPI003D6F0A59